MSSPPFGIPKGFSKNDIKVGEEILGYTYAVTDVPKPHSEFPRVFAQITPLQGVSHISAESWLIPLDDIGALRKLFFILRDQLGKKYGQPAIFQDYDFLDARKFSDLYFRWGGKNRPSLINNLKSVELNFFKKNLFHGFFVLRFFYDNYDQALKEIRNLDDDAI